MYPPQVMSIHPQSSGSAPSLRDRLTGVLLLLGSYGIATLVIMACRDRLQQSLLWLVLGPALLGSVWISTAMILANVVLGRIQGKRRLAAGVAYAALILIIVCVGILHIENQRAESHPSYRGP